MSACDLGPASAGPSGGAATVERSGLGITMATVNKPHTLSGSTAARASPSTSTMDGGFFGGGRGGCAGGHGGG